MYRVNKKLLFRKRKLFWCFKPVKEMGGQTAEQKEDEHMPPYPFHTKTPLCAYTHSSLQRRPARVLAEEVIMKYLYIKHSFSVAVI
jgi:hypothetical protein